MTPYPPRTIEEQGLENYLNDTADKHNGNDYDEWLKLYEAGVNDTNIGKVFGVKWRAAKNWRLIYTKKAKK